MIQKFWQEKQLTFWARTSFGVNNLTETAEAKINFGGLAAPR
jgi:hypothetical protein